MMLTCLRPVSLLLCCLALLAGCDQDPAPRVDLSKRATLTSREVQPGETTVNLCIGAMITPNHGYVYYERLIEYLRKHLSSAKIHVVDPGSYQQVNALLEEGKVDIAFICSGPYVDGHARFGLTLLAAPVVNGEAAYYSNLIVPNDSPARSLADLRGKTFAFTDPASNTGTVVPLQQLAALGATPETFFSSFSYTGSHDRSIQAVERRLVQGAGVDSLIWNYLAANQPELASKVKVIARYGPFASPPVVASPKTPEPLRQQVQHLLLTLDQTEEGQAILRGMHVDRFTKIEDAAYDSIRQMKTSLTSKSP